MGRAHTLVCAGTFSRNEAALCIELENRGIGYSRQHPITIRYRGQVIGEGRLDLLVEGTLIVEIKTVAVLAAVHFGQAIAYLEAARLPLALLINFDVARLKEGVRRVVLTPRNE